MVTLLLGNTRLHFLIQLSSSESSASTVAPCYKERHDAHGLSAYEKRLVEVVRKARVISADPYKDPQLAGAEAFLFREAPSAQPTTRNFEE